MIKELAEISSLFLQSTSNINKFFDVLIITINKLIEVFTTL